MLALARTPAAKTQMSYSMRWQLAPSSNRPGGPMQTSADRPMGSISATSPWMNAARGFAARIGSVIDLYSTVPTLDAASMGVKMKKGRGDMTSRR